MSRSGNGRALGRRWRTSPFASLTSGESVAALMHAAIALGRVS